jgi:FMN phosphatase YigB (HAD superfamily)
MSNLKTIIFDVDGTLANGDHREHLYGGREAYTWDAYVSASIDDTPHEQIQWLNHIMAEQPNVYIIVLTARSESGRNITIKWLEKHNIVYNELILKPESNVALGIKDDKFKENVLDELIARDMTPFMVFEDRQSVVNMWRNRNIKCLQVQPGDF